MADTQVHKWNLQLVCPSLSVRQPGPRRAPKKCSMTAVGQRESMRVRGAAPAIPKRCLLSALTRRRRWRGTTEEHPPQTAVCTHTHTRSWTTEPHLESRRLMIPPGYDAAGTTHTRPCVTLHVCINPPSAGASQPTDTAACGHRSLHLLPRLSLAPDQQGSFTWSKERTAFHSDANPRLLHFLIRVRQETLKFWEQDVCHTLEMFLSADNTQFPSATHVRKPHSEDLTEHAPRARSSAPEIRAGFPPHAGAALARGSPGRREQLKEEAARLGSTMSLSSGDAPGTSLQPPHTSLLKGTFSEIRSFFRCLDCLCSPGCSEYLKVKGTRSC